MEFSMKKILCPENFGSILKEKTCLTFPVQLPLRNFPFNGQPLLISVDAALWECLHHTLKDDFCSHARGKLLHSDN